MHLKTILRTLEMSVIGRGWVKSVTVCLLLAGKEIGVKRVTRNYIPLTLG